MMFLFWIKRINGAKRGMEHINVHTDSNLNLWTQVKRVSMA